MFELHTISSRSVYTARPAFWSSWLPEGKSRGLTKLYPLKVRIKYMEVTQYSLTLKCSEYPYGMFWAPKWKPTRAASSTGRTEDMDEMPIPALCGRDGRDAAGAYMHKSSTIFLCPYLLDGGAIIGDVKEGQETPNLVLPLPASIVILHELIHGTTDFDQDGNKLSEEHYG